MPPMAQFKNNTEQKTLLSLSKCLGKERSRESKNLQTVPDLPPASSTEKWSPSPPTAARAERGAQNPALQRL